MVAAPAGPGLAPAVPSASAPQGAPPWEQAQGVEAVIEAWHRDGAVMECVALESLRPSTEARFAPLPPDLPPGLVAALAARGVTQLYTHQRQAIDAARAGQHVVVATPTASGKSLCFHLPVLEALTTDPTASALFLYPTKALSRDQEHSLLGLIDAAGLPVPAVVFDGDTPGDARRAARERARVVLTNPDMLHAGILPNHARWASTFQNLRYVVLDELHTYRGVFGSHLAHVLGRLRRIAAFHGSSPRFITATATIGNPRSHAARLLGVPEGEVALVSESGAPEAGRRLFVVNPPVVNVQLGLRQSALSRSVAVAAQLIRARVPTLVFGPSRNSVEVMLKYLRAECGDVAGPGAIMAYRGGYLPEQRRAVERGLRAGEILGVVATNALELGIDIGELDAVVCAGYPGSVAALWQRFGRAGRRGAQSLAVLVCNNEALDQYVATTPEFLLKAGAEEARIDPSNVEILIQHLKCAAFEAPFAVTPPGALPARPAPAQGEGYLGLEPAALRDALEYLRGHGLVHPSGERYHWAGEAFPASHVSLRSVGWDNFVIIDLDTDRSLAELDWRAAHTMLHEQAIYQHDAEQYQVERLDYDDHKAFVRKVAPDYFTTALTWRTVEVLDVADTRTLHGATLGRGDVKVVEKVTGYKKVKFFTHENAGYGDVHLPEMQMHTQALWLTLPEAFIADLSLPRVDVPDILRGVGAALETVTTVALMCDPRDLNRTLGNGDGDGQLPGRNAHAGRTGQVDPTVFLFDAIPNGVGLAPRAFELCEGLLGRALELVTRCPCRGGCPACIGPGGDARRKAHAVAVLGRLSGTGARAPES